MYIYIYIYIICKCRTTTPLWSCIMATPGEQNQRGLDSSADVNAIGKCKQDRQRDERSMIALRNIVRDMLSTNLSEIGSVLQTPSTEVSSANSGSLASDHFTRTLRRRQTVKTLSKDNDDRPFDLVL